MALGRRVITRAAKRFIAVALARSGLPRLARRAYRDRLLVVCYHGLRSEDETARHWVLLPAAEFARQIAYLKRRYAVVPIDEGLIRLYQHQLDGPTACITFDDGYLNNLTLGQPVLAEHGVAATIFLATALLGTERTVWTVEVDLAFASSPLTVVSVPALGSEIQIDSPSARRVAAARVVAHAKSLPPALREPFLAPLLKTLTADRPLVPAAFRMLSWSEVAEMERTGLVTFGAHTMHHEIVSRLDDATLATEIGGSLTAVRAVATKPSRVFAYPNGRPQDFDARAEAYLRAAGCLGALSTIEGLATAQHSPFAVRRVVVGADMTFDDFVMRTALVDAIAARAGGA